MTDYTKSAEAEVEYVEGYEFTIIPVKFKGLMVTWEYPEFQCLCPVSGRHDQGVLRLTYRPKEWILESKSVRDFLALWRNKHIWQEYVTEAVATALFEAVRAEYLKVEIEWSPRGGIYATTSIERP